MATTATRVLNRPWVWLSFALLLYCMGLGCVLVVYAQQAMQDTRLSIPLYVEFEEAAKEQAIFKWQKALQQRPEVHAPSVVYISREQALAEWDEVETGIAREEVMIGSENPLPNTLQFTVGPEYTADYQVLATQLEQDSLVAEVYYTDVPLETWNEQLGQAEWLLLVVLLFFGIIVMTLLRSHVRLAWRVPQQETIPIPERRRWYWRQSVRNGLLAAVLAAVGVWVTRWWLEHQTVASSQSELEFWTSLTTAGLLLLGAVLPTWAAWYRPSEATINI